ncbi:MAG TPA: DNA primase [Candidatus Angelobacter sp.]|nr:DNA primase [Candidatus Angelobacter sp.]
MATSVDSLSIVKQQADIVRVVGEYVKLKKSGGQNFVGLCPFHQEKTPSFSVHATRQFFHCFGCGVSGDVIKFVQKIENISFPEALRLVAEKMEIKLPRQQFSSEQEGRDARLRAQLTEMHERAAKFFEEQLRRPEAAHVRQYLSGRGLSDDMMRAFRIGYAPDSGFTLRDLLKRDYDEELMRASGLFSWKEGAEAQIYSRFRNRVMFPIARDNGKIIAFTGRTLATDEKAGPKYLNSPETAIYSKSQLLYNLDKAKEAIRTYSHTILVEGQMDCISVYAAGFHNVVASSGTAFTEAQVRLLGRYSKNIIVNFDPDTAGANAAEKSIGMLVSEEFRVRVLRLEEGYDPDLFIRKKGAKAYEEALRRAPNYFDYLVDRALHSFPVRTPEGKKNAVNYLLPHVQRVPNRIERESLAQDLAQKLGIDSTVLRQEFRMAAAQRGKREVQAAAEMQLTPAEKVVIRALASILAEETALRDRALEAVQSGKLHVGLSTEALLELLIENAGKDVMGLELDDATRSLLARVLLREAEPLTEELLEGALEALRHLSHISQREREIKLAIVAAEGRGDIKELLRLKQEKLELDRKLAGLTTKF